MVLVKILGGLDLFSFLVFVMLIFGSNVPLQFILFCAGLLFLKGMFLFMGDVLSAVDIFAALMLILSIPFTLPSILLWIPAFLLLAKGAISFF